MIERVKEIHNQIKELQDELGIIKKECSHNKYNIGFYSYRIGSTEISKICDDCGENIGIPSKKEVDEFLKEQNI